MADRHDDFSTHYAQIYARAKQNFALNLRRHRIGSQLFNQALSMINTPNIKVLNINPEGESLIEFLKSKNIAPAAKQYEMILSDIDCRR